MVHRKYPTLAALIPSAVGVHMSFLSTVTGVALSNEDADDSSDDDAESTSTNEGDSDVSSDADSTCDEQEQAQQLPNMIPIVPVPVRHRRRTFARKPMNQNTFWTSFLSPKMKAVYFTDPDGRESSQFRRAFRVPYSLLKEKILEFSIQMWWPDWHDFKVDAFGRPVAYLELKLLGALCTLGNSTTHFMVSLQTNVSEEVHRKLF